MNETKIDELRKRRARLASIERAKRAREVNGPRIVASLAPAIGDGVTLADFDIDVEPPLPIEPLQLKSSSEWTELALSKDRVLRIAACIEENLGSFDGLVGLLANDYLGLCRVRRISITGMVDAADAIEEAVVFYPRDIAGAILIDCYKSPPGYPPFSLYVQGRDLAEALRPCRAD
ncbi:hypothetical protein [Luteibacter sp. UNCMF366Tsu5.1]|uniref:hypothetical protein n=1 Tax=Luteibacter sp. UNCMF366Tsu5.1 TaxID=1502758 RepID=UPI000908F21B|nr:hypothetical protein [Luteibacter sp. UNCMF366Tsu5.1]SFW75396.1 hypothetical protein SAMN02800691_3545 [Luteibacter sp. UNCMF366Tsu5.1]